MNAAERTEAPDASTLAVMTGPTSEAVLHPLVMVDDQKVLPRDYIVHHRSQRCLNCGTTHEWSDTYARNEVPANFNIGTVQDGRLIAFGWMDWNFGDPGHECEDDPHGGYDLAAIEEQACLHQAVRR